MIVVTGEEDQEWWVRTSHVALSVVSPHMPPRTQCLSCLLAGSFETSSGEYPHHTGLIQPWPSQLCSGLALQHHRHHHHTNTHTHTHTHTHLPDVLRLHHHTHTYTHTYILVCTYIPATHPQALSPHLSTYTHTHTRRTSSGSIFVQPEVLSGGSLPHVTSGGIQGEDSRRPSVTAPFP